MLISEQVIKELKSSASEISLAKSHLQSQIKEYKHGLIDKIIKFKAGNMSEEAEAKIKNVRYHWTGSVAISIVNLKTKNDRTIMINDIKSIIT